MDSELWNHSHGAHPVDTFWPGRFLEYADGPESPRFSSSGTESSWIPFGSGANLCPGRQFAKTHCILSIAMMVDNFDCDILAEPRNLRMDTRKFGMGVLDPSGKIAVRLRKREMTG